jgi:hypothetical protein
MRRLFVFCDEKCSKPGAGMTAIRVELITNMNRVVILCLSRQRKALKQSRLLPPNGHVRR